MMTETSPKITEEPKTQSVGLGCFFVRTSPSVACFLSLLGYFVGPAMVLIVILIGISTGIYLSQKINNGYLHTIWIAQVIFGMLTMVKVLMDYYWYKKAVDENNKINSHLV
jgi:hypothetical protein